MELGETASLFSGLKEVCVWVCVIVTGEISSDLMNSGYVCEIGSERCCWEGEKKSGPWEEWNVGKVITENKTYSLALFPQIFLEVGLLKICVLI